MPFEQAWPYQEDLLALPVSDADEAATWYASHFGLTEVERPDAEHKTVIMERDGVRFGFAENGGKSEEEGAAILVRDIQGVRDELEGRGVQAANWRVDERDGREFQVFFVIAPDGLCYYFHEPLRG